MRPRPARWTEVTMSARIKFTPELRDKFLEALEASLTVTKACEALGIGRRTVYDARKSDPEFAAAWDAAYERGTAALEDEAVRRAYYGVPKPVYYKGAKCGELTEYSDTLLMFMLKVRDPAKY